MKTAKIFLIFYILLIAVLCCLPNCVAETSSPSQSGGEIVIGDVDSDGKITAKDARLVLRASAKLEETDLARMDADSDGKVSAADARLVLRYSAKLEPVLPVPRGSGSEEPGKSSGALVAYFSRTGNTRPLAEYAAEALDADIYEIRALVPYTDEDIRYYTDCRADREQNDPSARPDIADPLPDISGYDTILIGYPIWHGQAPKIIYTFIEGLDLSGKTIVPFCTSGSSPVGTSDTNLHPLAPGAVWKAGTRFAAGTSKDEIIRWLTETGLKQAEQKEEIALELKINDTVPDVQWEDNDSVAALTELAKKGAVTVRMSMYGGFEQVGALGTSLPRNDVSTTTGAGDIVLYNGNQIVVFYGSNTWSYTRLGKIRGMDDQALADLLGNGAVTLTLSAVS